MKNIASLCGKKLISFVELMIFPGSPTLTKQLYLINSLHTTDQAGLELLILSANPQEGKCCHGSLQMKCISRAVVMKTIRSAPHFLGGKRKGKDPYTRSCVLVQMLLSKLEPTQLTSNPTNGWNRYSVLVQLFLSKLEPTQWISNPTNGWNRSCVLVQMLLSKLETTQLISNPTNGWNMSCVLVQLLLSKLEPTQLISNPTLGWNTYRGVLASSQVLGVPLSSSL
jgi:hypothetical protein